jgi:hypothetical protein
VGFTIASALDAVVLLTCLALAFSKSRWVHTVGLALVWVSYLAGAIVEVRA